MISEKALKSAIESTYGFEAITLSEVKRDYVGPNTVFYMTSTTTKGFVRVTTRANRSKESLDEEINFVCHLKSRGVSVAKPYQSLQGEMINSFNNLERELYYVIFEVAPGEQLCDRGYRYIEGVPLSQHHYNCGLLLGKLHKASEGYQSIKVQNRDHLLEYYQSLIKKYLPKELLLVKEKFKGLISQLEKLEKSPDKYGMVHGDFGDGNYNIDYTNGDVTLYDFDDAGYCWYMFEVASAWAGAVGWASYEESIQKRKEIMEEFFETFLKGYRSVRELTEEEVSQLPLFLKLNEMEYLLAVCKDMSIEDGAVDVKDEGLMVLINRVENDLLYMGLFE